MVPGFYFDDVNIFLGSLALSQPRILAACAILPIFNQQILPRLLRYSICIALGLILVPVLAAQTGASNTTGLSVVMLIGKEVFIGFALGFLFAIPFWVFESVGFLIDAQRGASIGVTFNPISGNETSPLGMLFNQAFMIFFLVGGGFTLMLSVLYDSYVLWNVWDFYPKLNPKHGTLILGQLSRFMEMTVLFASPALIAMFLSEFGMGLINRFAPQLQVFFLSMPIKSALAILVLILYMNTLFEYGTDLLEQLHNALPFYNDQWKAK